MCVICTTNAREFDKQVDRQTDLDVNAKLDMLYGGFLWFEGSCSVSLCNRIGLQH